MKRIRFSVAVALVALVASVPGLPTSSIAQEAGLEFPWYFSFGAGQLNYEGDEELEDGYLLYGGLGYDYSEWWTLEATLTIAPDLKANYVGNTTVDKNGNVVFKRIRKANVDSTWAAGLAVDGLFHFTRWDRLDPFLSLGGGILWYGDKVNGESFDPSIRAGGGVMYHFNDVWAARADIRTYIAGNDTEANAIIRAGLAWYWGAGVAPDLVAIGGPMDSDGDGLPDNEEAQWGTDPYDPDSDADGLSDGEEVYQYKTNPLNPDTDYDGLTDGYDEVQKYRTNPLERDTDNGGVADGHEVIEDGTNPLDPSDDLLLYELYIQFDYDRSEIKPEFFDDLDIVGKVLSRDPGSTARIEGHADRLKKSKSDYNKRLSKRRAEAVLAYLADQADINESRMTAHGYGFDRPKEANDLQVGNPVNRRVEIYIRRSQTDGGDFERITN
ncbi:MAG: OmpA family protein [Verrucomicrobia bacterium]|nr:OmpA family protein [Verrucomicrobiota bacterium]